MKTSFLAVLALSLGASDAFISPAGRNNLASTAVNAFNGPQMGGTEGSSNLPEQYGTVGVDSPWGNRNPFAGYTVQAGQKMLPGGMARQDMPLAKGQIMTVTGG